MTTSALTLADFGSKNLQPLASYVTPEVLDLINNSEVLKSIFREYASSTTVDPVAIGTTSPDSASYSLPNGSDRGFATFGVNRLTNAFDFIAIVSHDLGHFPAEYGLYTQANGLIGAVAAAAPVQTQQAPQPARPTAPSVGPSGRPGGAPAAVPFSNYRNLRDTDTHNAFVWTGPNSTYAAINWASNDESYRRVA